MASATEEESDASKSVKRIKRKSKKTKRLISASESDPKRMRIVKSSEITPPVFPKVSLVKLSSSKITSSLKKKAVPSSKPAPRSVKERLERNEGSLAPIISTKANAKKPKGKGHDENALNKTKFKNTIEDDDSLSETDNLKGKNTGSESESEKGDSSTSGSSCESEKENDGFNDASSHTGSTEAAKAVERESSLIDLLDPTITGYDDNHSIVHLNYRGQTTPVNMETLLGATPSVYEKYGISQPTLVTVDVARLLVEIVENQKFFHEKLNSMATDLAVIKQILSHTTVGSSGSLETHLPFKLPIKTLEDQDKIETFLEQKENKRVRKTLIDTLALLGGSEISEAASGILKALMSKDLRLKYNAQKAVGDKKSFQGTVLFDVAKESIRVRLPKVDEKTILQHMGTVFTRTPDEKGGRETRRALAAVKRLAVAKHMENVRQQNEAAILEDGREPINAD